MTRKVFVLATVLCAGLAAGCGGGDGGAGLADDTALEITSDQLAQMVLALEQFGPEYGGFTPEPDNGLVTLDAAAEDDFDPAQERSDLQNSRWASGYEVYYSGELAGVIFAGTNVQLFTDAEGAKEYFKDSEAELTDDLGRTVDGVTMTKIEFADVDIAGAHEAMSGWFEASVQNEDGTTEVFWATATVFRRGRLLGAVAMFAQGIDDLEEKRLQGKVESLAPAMNERIGSVLSASAPIPAPDAAAGQ